MKKYKYILVVLTLWISLLQTTQFVYANQTKVVDEPNILTSEQETTLTNKINEIISRYQFDIAIIIVNSTDGQNVTSYADDYFDNNDYGVGTNDDGALLLLDYQNREIAISTHGYGLTAFTDYGLDYIFDNMVPDFRNDDFYSGFQRYLNISDRFLEEARYRQPFDANNEITPDKNYALNITIGIIGGGLFAFLVLQTMKSKLKSVRPEKAAGQYIDENGLVLSDTQDIFLYSTTTKTKIVKPQPSTQGAGFGGGSSSHTSSSGRTHGGGSRHF